MPDNPIFGSQELLRRAFGEDVTLNELVSSGALLGFPGGLPGRVEEQGGGFPGQLPSGLGNTASNVGKRLNTLLFGPDRELPVTSPSFGDLMQGLQTLDSVPPNAARSFLRPFDRPTFDPNLTFVDLLRESGVPNPEVGLLFDLLTPTPSDLIVPGLGLIALPPPLRNALSKTTKVVDRSGEPIRLIHGTDQVFDAFQIRPPTHAQTKGRGIYFTQLPESLTSSEVFDDYKETVLRLFRNNIPPERLPLLNQRELRAMRELETATSFDDLSAETINTLSNARQFMPNLHRRTSEIIEDVFPNESITSFMSELGQGNVRFGFVDVRNPLELSFPLVEQPGMTEKVLRAIDELEEQGLRLLGPDAPEFQRDMFTREMAEARFLAKSPSTPALQMWVTLVQAMEEAGFSPSINNFLDPKGQLPVNMTTDLITDALQRQGIDATISRVGARPNRFTRIGEIAVFDPKNIISGVDSARDFARRAVQEGTLTDDELAEMAGILDILLLGGEKSAP